MFLGKRENSGNCDKNEGSGVLRKISDMRFWENKSVFGDFSPFLGTFLGKFICFWENEKRCKICENKNIRDDAKRGYFLLDRRIPL